MESDNSNSDINLEKLPKLERSTKSRRLDLNRDEVPAQRALGIQWSMETDTFSFNISIKPCQPNRRGILSLVSSTFNPLGFAVPFVLVATEMLQDLCAPN